MRSSATVFPDQIDHRIYWSDISIPQVDTMTEYQNRLSEQDYDGALELINNSDVFNYGGWLFNMFRNRLLALEDYIPYLIISIANIYSPIEPTEVVDSVFTLDDEGNLVKSVVWIDGNEVHPRKADMSVFVTYSMMVSIDDETIDGLFDGG